MCEPKQWRERSLPHPLHDHTSLTHIWTGVCPSHLHSQPCLPHPYLHGQEGQHLCPSHFHSQPCLPHPYLERRDMPLSLPPPLTATPPSPIPGQEGHTSVPPTSTHSHTSLTHTWTGGTHLCPSHLHSQPHLPHPYLDRRDTPLSLPPPLTAHTSLTHIYLDTLKKRILNQSSCKEYHRPRSC